MQLASSVAQVRALFGSLERAGQAIRTVFSQEVCDVFRRPGKSVYHLEEVDASGLSSGKSLEYELDARREGFRCTTSLSIPLQRRRQSTTFTPPAPKNNAKEIQQVSSGWMVETGIRLERRTHGIAVQSRTSRRHKTATREFVHRTEKFFSPSTETTRRVPVAPFPTSVLVVVGYTAEVPFMGSHADVGPFVATLQFGAFVFSTASASQLNFASANKHLSFQ